MWTRFMDMHSGGDSKEDFGYLYVELPEEKAISYFENKFGHDPFNVTCECCGCDYSVSEYETLEAVTEYERGNGSLEEFEKLPYIKIIRKEAL